MKSNIELKDIQDAMDRAHQIRSEEVHKLILDVSHFVADLFKPYNPQMLFRR